MPTGATRAVPFERSIAAIALKALALWDHSRNQPSPTEVGAKANVPMHWVCPADPEHQYVKRVFEVCALLEAGYEPCPYCNGRLVLPKGSLAVRHPDVVREWDVSRNAIGADAVRHDSGRRAFWKCATCSRTSTASVAERVTAPACKRCNPKQRQSFDARIADWQEVARRSLSR